MIWTSEHIGLLPGYLRAFRFARPTTRSNSVLMRVCQPAPPERKWASTSGESRSFTACFGLSSFGRPRRTSLSPSYRSAFLNCSSVSSGASSYSSGRMTWASAFFKSLPAERQAKLKAGLTPEREAEVLAAWHKQHG